MKTIQDLVDVVEKGDHFIEDWEKALVALARAAGVSRVLTDHPDLLASKRSGGVVFFSTDQWLVEQTTPPPPPVV